MPSPATEGSPSRAAVAEKVQAILASKQLTLYRVSQESAKFYGRSSPFFLPHNLYYDLRTGSFIPSIHQISALSRVSGYRVIDWLRVFGYALEDITRLQVEMPSKRTFVLDTSLTDSNEWIPWFDNRADGVSIPSIAPMAKLLKAMPAQRIRSLKNPGARNFLYVKVGTEDALAFPDLAPGSIVRVNPDVVDCTRGENSPISDFIFLVEHSKGFCCCRVGILDSGAIVLVDNRHRHARVELRCPQEAKIWGRVDFEFRPLLHTEEPDVPKDLARRWRPQTLPSDEAIGQLLKTMRRRRRLSVRDAARVSRTIADVLKDDRYMISPSSLSDYELRKVAPRDFHKIMSLSSIYGLQFESVMRGIGIDLAEAGAESMPDRYVFRLGSPPASAKGAVEGGIRAGFLERLLENWQDVPFFLRHSLGYFSGSAHVSLDDFFWVGGDHDPLHPYLVNALVVMVNRRRKTPLHFGSKPLWQQPIYVVLKRDGTHFAGCCGVENGALVVYSYTRDFRRDEEYRLHQDAEVVGEIVAIARRIP